MRKLRKISASLISLIGVSLRTLIANIRRLAVFGDSSLCALHSFHIVNYPAQHNDTMQRSPPPDIEAQASWHQERVDEWDPDFHTPRNKSATAPKYGDPSATFWNLYMSKAEIYDQKLVESLLGHTNSMVFLVTLFSAIVGSFIIETYKTLLPAGSNNQLVTNGSRSQAVRINVVLFLSFFLSIISVVSCAFVQQWCYEYLKLAYPRVGAAPHERGRVRTYLFQGFAQFQVWKFMHGAHALLHISVFLFFGPSATSSTRLITILASSPVTPSWQP
ncbi:hypothetical protein BJV77DRAFT_554459 [Russula vinacea]|nr:hypothetical protein BJV77DRAFT_554459 [Russula vinacea]